MIPTYVLEAFAVYLGILAGRFIVQLLWEIYQDYVESP